MKWRFPAASGKRVLNHGWTQMEKRSDGLVDYWMAGILRGKSIYPTIHQSLGRKIRVHPWLNSGFQNVATFPQTRFSKKGSP